MASSSKKQQVIERGKVNIRKSDLPKVDKDQPWASMKEISALVGFSTVSLYKWKRVFPDFPEPDRRTGKYEVAKMLQWMEDHPDIGQPGQRVEGKREDLMCENLRLRNAQIEAQIAESQYRLVDIDRVLAVFTQERTLVLEAFRKRMISELPAELEGKTARQISAGLQAALNEFFQDVQDSIPRIIQATHV